MKQRLFKFAGIVIVLASFIISWLIMDVRSFARIPLNTSDASVYYVVNKGMNLNRIAVDLNKRGMVKSSHHMVWLGRMNGGADNIKAGEYEILPGMLPTEFLDMLTSGKVILHSLTLVEGWNFKQIMDAIHSDEYLVHTLKGVDNDAVMTHLGLPDLHPEGRFFPDTYKFSRDMTDVDFLKRAYHTMTKVLTLEWANRDPDLPYKDPYEALIMASIIEKETALPSERKAIAGVFVRRLQKGMRLQTDPTIIYGMGEKYKGNIRRSDLTTDTPYNTYRINGLPPTPIATPGTLAINAALHPEPGNTLYFVAKGDGSHKFSDTLDEHNQAVIKYQLNGRKRAFSSMRKTEPE
ncbi:MAG: endolytic transglycosylase MltG [Gammaproteobacteria bacterium]|nr:endolytic transglycosylase MltG [Gammaproteobacteria bacterium]